MKTFFRISLIVGLLVLLGVSVTGVLAQTPTPEPGNLISGDQVVVGNTYRLEPGDVLNGNLLVIGGTATISQGASISGDVVLTGGTISILGVVNGDVVAIGGAVNVEEYATVNGDITMIGASLKRSPLAQITGSVSEETPKIFNFDFKDSTKNLPFTPALDPLTRMLNASFQALGLAILAVIIGLILPNQLKRVADTVIREPLIAGGVGLGTIIVAPIVLVLLTITIILIPITILSVMVLALAILFGFVAVGFEVGQRIASLFKTTWHVSISAGIGVLLLSLVTGFASLIPCVGWLIGFIVSIFGLGAVVISRFGSSKYANRVVQSVISANVPQEPTDSPENLEN